MYHWNPVIVLFVEGSKNTTNNTGGMQDALVCKRPTHFNPSIEIQYGNDCIPNGLHGPVEKCTLPLS